jgi:hypothetical protein
VPSIQLRTMASIAAELRLSRASVSRWRGGIEPTGGVEPAPLPRPYERARLGELLHVDSKKVICIERTGQRTTGDPRDVVRRAGWDAAFVAIDDRSWMGFAETSADERKPNAAAFLDRAVRYYRRWAYGYAGSRPTTPRCFARSRSSRLVVAGACPHPHEDVYRTHQRQG